MVSVANIVINARNLTGAAFGGVQTGLGGLQRTVQGLTGRLGGLKSAFGGLASSAGDASTRSAQSMNLLNAGMLRLAAAVGLVTLAYSKLSSVAQTALAEQQEQLTSAIGLAGQFNISIAKGEQISRDIAVSTATLGKNLPVSSQDINKINNAIAGQVATVIKKQGGTAEQYQRTLLGLSPKIAIAGAGRPADETSAAITGYLSGSVGKGGIDNYKFFSQNAAILENMKDILEKEYKGKDFTNLETAQRLKILTTSLEKFQTPAAVARLQQTPQAQISAFQDSLFDSYIGLFGIQRDLNTKTKEVESVYASFEKTISKLLGERGLFAQLGRTLGLAKVDPLIGVRNAIESFNGYLDSVTKTLSSMKSLSPQQIGAGIGKFSAQAVNVVLDGILKALGSVDYGAVVGAVGAGILSFFANLDWKVYAVGAAVALGAFLLPVIAGALAAVGSAILGAIVAAFGGLPVLIIAAIGLGIAALIKLLTDNWKSIQNYGASLGRTIQTWYTSVQNAVKNVFNAVKDALIFTVQFLFGREAPNQIAAFTKTTIDGIGKLLGIVGRAIADAVGFAVNLIKTLFGGIVSAFNAIFKAASDAVNGVIDAIKSLIAAVITPLQNAVNSLAKSIPNYVQNTINSGGLINNAAVRNTAVSTVTGGLGGFVSSIAGNAIANLLPKYGGQIPTAASGFLEAVATESRNAPSGAGLVLANSSEYILTPTQMSNLVNGLSTSGRTVNISFGAGAIALNLPAGTPQEIALQAITIIEQRLAQELEARL
ncbi:MAG: hypothetical protein KME30_32075 [Iphinoe sp. HA4291-MV1]|jgi:hypothetical protein|nr:hypothetical protein [Iphinoe sp. HA4291-MV1]